MANANGNGTANGNGEAKKERAEAVRIMNLKSVAEQLELSEQRVRNLVHEDKLTIEERALEGTDIKFNIIPQSSVDAYKELVASGEVVSRKRSADHTAYTVYVPNGEIGEQLLKFLADNNVKHSVRASKKNDDASDDGETVNVNGTTELETERRASVTASIPE